MSSTVSPTRVRRRKVAAGIAAGVIAGAALGATLLGHTAPSDVPAVRPQVLHAAPAVVTAGAEVALAATALCQDPLQPTCSLQRAVALVRPAGADGWTRVDGQIRTSGIVFRVPGELVPPDGFSYWLDVVTDAGAEIAYPPAGADGPIRVVTSAGLPERALAPFHWDVRAAPATTVMRLRSGHDDGEVGFIGAGTEDGIQGPSSFDVTPQGAVLVADPVNRRVQWFSRSGRFLRAAAIPTTHPIDVASLADGGVVLATLGTESSAYELDPKGDLAGSYPIGFGVVSRVAAGDVPRARIGEGQWVAVRGARGTGLSADAQSRSQTSSVPLDGGAIGYAGEVQDGRLAVIWTRPDGSRGGVVLSLPPGVRAGADYFVRPLGDGGALVARGLWDDAHFGVALLRLSATGGIRSFSLLPEPSRVISAPYSTVRFASARAVVMAVDVGRAVVIERFDVH
jgi:hypothetical protein